MKILSITAQKPDSTGSGVYLTELVRGFEKMGISQAVIAGVTREDTVDLPEDVRFFPVYFESEELPFAVAGMSDEMPYASTRYSDMTGEMTERVRGAFAAALARAQAKFAPDVILCHHLYYLAALVREMCPDTPVYGISHGSDLRQIKKNPWERAYIFKWIPELDGIFALHGEQKAEICALYGCEERKVRIIGTGYNSEVFYIDEAVWAKRRDAGELRLIFAGKLSEKKGVKSLLRAMRVLPELPGAAAREVTLTLAGGYGTEEEYRDICALAEGCPCKVEFAGRLPQRELAKRLNESDVFILPSFYEGLPLVVVEAMACALRVVCTDLPGIRPWLDEKIPGNGVIFVKPPGMQNEDEPVAEELPEFERRLAEAILEALGKELPDRAAVERISWDGLCGRLEAVFAERIGS